MDLADASLIWLGHETGLREIMTIDVKDFPAIACPMAKRSRCCERPWLAILLAAKPLIACA